MANHTDFSIYGVESLRLMIGALRGELEQDDANGTVRSDAWRANTQRMVDMMQAEVDVRTQRAPFVDVALETVDGFRHKLPFAVRVF